MNHNFKCITGYDPKMFTDVEIEIINDINLNVNEFIDTKSLVDFCYKKTYSPPSIDKLAKKLGHKTAKDLKNFITKTYYEKCNISNKFNFDHQKSEGISNTRIKFLKEYLNRSALCLFNLNWVLIEKFRNEMINKKTIYVLHSDDIFSLTNLELICTFFKKTLIVIKSEYRLEYINKFSIDKDSLLIICKMYKPLNSVETMTISMFLKHNIPIYLISSSEEIMKHEKFKTESINKIIIGNFSNFDNHLYDIANYKMMYDQIFNIVCYEIFLELLNRQE